MYRSQSPGAHLQFRKSLEVHMSFKMSNENFVALRSHTNLCQTHFDRNNVRHQRTCMVSSQTSRRFSKKSDLISGPCLLAQLWILTLPPVTNTQFWRNWSLLVWSSKNISLAVEVSLFFFSFPCLRRDSKSFHDESLVHLYTAVVVETFSFLMKHQERIVSICIFGKYVSIHDSSTEEFRQRLHRTCPPKQLSLLSQKHWKESCTPQKTSFSSVIYTLCSL